MASQAGRGGVAVLGAKPELPFVLHALPSITDDPRIDAILQKLDALLENVASSRLETESLRQISLQVLQAVRLAPAPEASAVAARPVESQATAVPLRLRLMGAFEAHAHGRPITDWPSKKARLLLAYLAVERGRMVPKDALIELFWPDTRSERGSNNLSIAVHQLRSTLARIDPALAQAMVVRQGLYGLDHALVHVDVWDVRAQLTEARQSLERKDNDSARRHLTSAVDLCSGELLESDPYEDWLLEPRRWLGSAYLQALAWLAMESSERSDWPAVLEFAGRIMRREHCDEAAHRWLMLAHWKLGNRSQALQQFRICEESLRDDLGVEPSDETRRLYLRVKGGLV